MLILRTDHVVSDGVGSRDWGWLNDLKKKREKKISLQTNLEWKTFSHRCKQLIFATKKIRKKVDHNCGLRKIYILNNYSPKAKLILLNNPQEEVEGIIHKLYHLVPIPSPSKGRWSVPVKHHYKFNYIYHVTSNEVPGELSLKTGYPHT